MLGLCLNYLCQVSNPVMMRFSRVQKLSPKLIVILDSWSLFAQPEFDLVAFMLPKLRIF